MSFKVPVIFFPGLVERSRSFNLVVIVVEIPSFKYLHFFREGVNDNTRISYLIYINML